MRAENGSESAQLDGSGRRSMRSCRADVRLVGLKSESDESFSMDCSNWGMAFSSAAWTKSTQKSRHGCWHRTPASCPIALHIAPLYRRS